MEKLTLEERIARAAKSQAASPEAAAGLVRQLARTQTVLLFHAKADLDLMYGLIGPYMDRVEDDVLHYAGFCHSINLAFMEDVPQVEDVSQAGAKLSMGTRTSSAMVLLGLMLLDHAKGRGRDKEVYHCTRMTLRQYLDALETVALPGDKPPARNFRRWREQFLEFYAPSVPLADVLSDLLRLYIHGWKWLDCLDYGLRCMEKLSHELERAPEERRPELIGHYMDLVNGYSWDVPDPAGEDVSAGDVREQIFLPSRDFGPASLGAVSVPDPAFQTFWEQLTSERRLSTAMAEVNQAVTNLYMLWVGPYLWMKEDL